jgi:hypothetical protein
VANNEITGNGTKDHGETALLFNAISSHAVKNNIHDNQVFFGIDAGGMFQSVVSGNTIRNNGTVGRGNGLNIGGSVGDVVSNNGISNNGRVQIYYARQEAGDVYFPWDSGVSEISGNQVTITAPSQIAMELLGSPQHLVVKDNVFDGPSAMRLVATTAAASEWHGNRYLRSQSDYSVPASEWLVLPDWIETAQIIGGGRISTITTETAAANAGKVVDVVMTNRGRNYTAAPAVSFKGGGCSGVSGAAKLSGDGRVSQVLVTSPGTGCTSPPGVSLSGGGGTGATAAVPVLGTPLADGRQMALRFTAKTTLAASGNLRLKGGGEVGVPAGGLITFAARSGDLVEAKRNF